MIIVEGIDRVGKTTLVNLLRERTGLPILNDKYYYIGKEDVRENKRVNTEKIQSVINFARDISDRFIVDRLHWSELVYGEVDRGYANLDVLNLENELVELGAKIILVTPTDLDMSSKEHGKDLSNHESLFTKLFEESNLDKFKCNYKSLDKAVEWVISDEKYNVL